MNKKTLLHVIQGAAVGVGAILPSISGGLLCVAFGIYEALMELYTAPVKAIKKNWKMFVPFGFGWVIGFVLLARVCERFFSAFPNVAIMLFLGLICGTLPNMFKDSEASGSKTSWTPLVVSALTSYILFHIIEGGQGITVPANFWSFVFCGVLWGLSMIVPGLSSSTLLIYLGLYVPLADGIASLNLSVLLPMGVGIALTVVALSKLVNWLYKTHRAVTTRTILGFVIASSLKTVPNHFNGGWDMAISLLCCAVGFVLAVLMERRSNQ